METKPAVVKRQADRQTDTHIGNYLESMAHRRHTGPNSARFLCMEIVECCAAMLQGVTVAAPAFS